MAPRSMLLAGTVKSVDGDTAVVSYDANDGDAVGSKGVVASMKVTLQPDTLFVFEADRKLSDLSAGQFIGTVIGKTAEGPPRAEEVHIFGTTQFRDADEGCRPLHGLYFPTRAVVAGTVTEIAAAPSGDATLRLRFRGAVAGDDAVCGGGSKPTAAHDGTTEITIAIPRAAPVVAFEDGSRSALVPGAAVFVATTPQVGGNAARAITIGKNGVRPSIALGATDQIARGHPRIVNGALAGISDDDITLDADFAGVPVPGIVMQTKIRLLPETIYFRREPRKLSDIRQGDRLETASVPASDGERRAFQVRINPAADNREYDEGRLKINNVQTGAELITGTVTSITGLADGGVRVTLHYRGAVAGADSCYGFAAAVVTGCEADAEIEIPSNTPVTAIATLDRSALASAKRMSVWAEPGLGTLVATSVTVDGE